MRLLAESNRAGRKGPSLKSADWQQTHDDPAAGAFLEKLTLTSLQKLTATAGAEALSHALEAFTAIDRGGSPSWPRSRSS